MKIGYIYNKLDEGLIMSHDPVAHSSFLRRKYPEIRNVVMPVGNPYIERDNNDGIGPTGNYIRIDVLDYYSLDDINKDMLNLYGWKFVMLSAVIKDVGLDYEEVCFKLNPDSKNKYDKFISVNLKEPEVMTIILGECEDVRRMSIYYEAKYGDKTTVEKDYYRVIPVSRAPKVERIGFAPTAQLDDPVGRVYFGSDIDEIDDMIGSLDKFKDGKAIFRLKVSEYHDEINSKYVFYQDPCSPSSVYTMDCIHPKYLERIK